MKRRRQRIAMIGTRGVPATVGGVERAVEELSARLVAAGYDVTVYCRTSYSTTRPPTYRAIRLRYLPVVNTKHLEAISHSLLATLHAAVKRYDVVHFHGIGPGLCAPIARLAGLRVVTTVHALDFRRAKWGRTARRVLKLGAWCAARLPHRTVVVSKELQTYFESEYGTHATYVPNGVELSAESLHSLELVRARRESGHFLFLGRLVPEKGIHTLIEAYRHVETSVPLVIAGSASHSGGYEERLHELGKVDPRISFVGPVLDEAKADLVRNTYAFCQPSTLEGLPIVLLEMMSEGICPIVSDIPEHLEVVTSDHGSSAAISFQAGDATALRAALEAALAQPETVSERGAQARAIVAERYSWGDATAQVAAVYADIVDAESE